MAIMKKANKEDAVSPVIGVMLMLVVTIVIAAVVAAFATGMGDDVESVPSAALKATIVDSSSGDLLYLNSISGDRIDLNKVTVIVYKSGSKLATYTNPSKLPGVGQYLDAGETIDVKKASGSSSSFSVSKGEIVEVVVQYDASSILYDKEVTVQ